MDLRSTNARAYLDRKGIDDIQRQIGDAFIVEYFCFSREIFISGPIQHRYWDIPRNCEGEGGVGKFERCAAKLLACLAKEVEVIGESLADALCREEMRAAEKSGATRQIFF